PIFETLARAGEVARGHRRSLDADHRQAQRRPLEERRFLDLCEGGLGLRPALLADERRGEAQVRERRQRDLGAERLARELLAGLVVALLAGELRAAEHDRGAARALRHEGLGLGEEAPRAVAVAAGPRDVAEDDEEVGLELGPDLALERGLD